MVGSEAGRPKLPPARRLREQLDTAQECRHVTGASPRGTEAAARRVRASRPPPRFPMTAPEDVEGAPALARREVAAFTNLARGLAEAQTLDAVLGVIATEVDGALGLEDCVICLVDHARGVCVRAPAHGHPAPLPGAGRDPLEIPVGRGTVGRAAATGVAQRVPDVRERPDHVDDGRRHRSELAVPILYDDLVLGVIASAHDAVGFFTPRHLEVVTAIARLSAPRLNVERLLAEMTRLTHFYEQVLDALPTQIGVLSPSGVFEYVNPAAIADPAMRRWIVGKTNADYGARRGLPMEVVAQRVAREQEAARTGRPVEFEETFRTRDGRLRRYYRYIAPIVDAQGTVRHLVSGGSDVTELRALQERVAAAERAEEPGGESAEGGAAP